MIAELADVGVCRTAVENFRPVTTPGVESTPPLDFSPPLTMHPERIKVEWLPDSYATWDEATEAFKLHQVGTRSSHYSNKFDSQWSKRRWAKLLEFDRTARARFEDCYTALLTFTASTVNEFGTPIPPIDHYHHLQSSKETRIKRLKRLIPYDFVYYEVTGIHRSGYCHIHLGLWIDGPVGREHLEPAIDAHVNNCDYASWDGHPSESISAIRPVGDTLLEANAGYEPASGLAGYLGWNLPGLVSGGVLGEEEHRIRGAAVLAAGGIRPTSSSRW